MIRKNYQKRLGSDILYTFKLLNGQFILQTNFIFLQLSYDKCEYMFVSINIRFGFSGILPLALIILDIAKTSCHYGLLFALPNW